MVAIIVIAASLMVRVIVKRSNIVTLPQSIITNAPTVAGIASFIFRDLQRMKPRVTKNVSIVITAIGCIDYPPSLNYLRFLTYKYVKNGIPFGFKPMKHAIFFYEEE